MLCQISLVWSNIKKNGRTIGLLSLHNWCGVNLWRNKEELSTLVYRTVLGELKGGLRIWQAME